jgi:hypothetical protein
MATRKAEASPPKPEPVFLVDEKYSTETVEELQSSDPLGYLMFDCARYDSTSVYEFNKRVRVIFESVMTTLFISIGAGFKCTHTNYIVLRDMYSNMYGFQAALPEYKNRDVTKNHDGAVQTACGRMIKRMGVNHDVVFDIKPPKVINANANAVRKSRSTDTLRETVDAKAVELGIDALRACVALRDAEKLDSPERDKLDALRKTITKEQLTGPDIADRRKARKSAISSYTLPKLAACEVWDTETDAFGEMPWVDVPDGAWFQENVPSDTSAFPEPDVDTETE